MNEAARVSAYWSLSWSLDIVIKDDVNAIIVARMLVESLFASTRHEGPECLYNPVTGVRR